MGCAGSKPHHLLSSSITHHHHHTNSPQKGFILFNSKTIEYLKANEAEIKTKLVERCQHKLLKTQTNGTITSKSLFGTSKKAAATAEKEPTKATTADKISELVRFKESAIESAVDYVLKYAINDFDIENFKSSNHLSMKQIRKDIMKKYSGGVASMSKLSVQANTSTLSKEVNGGTNTTTAAANASTLSHGGLGTLKNSESAFYKLALNTTIDEFGLFIQENFVVINEFNAANKINSSGSLKKPSESEAAKNDEEAALKLKEALELARQNFYKGKMSMVCLTKTGGYVVKEVKESENAAEATATAVVQEPVESPAVAATDEKRDDSLANGINSLALTATPTKEPPSEPATTAATGDSPITPENLSSAKTVTILDPQTNQKSKVAISSKINIEDVDISATFKIIETNQNEFAAANTSATQPDEPQQTLNTSNTSHTELTAKKPSRSLLRLSKKESKSSVKAAAKAAAAEAKESLAEYLKLKSGLTQLLNETIDSIVAYSTSTESQAEADGQALELRLTKAKEVVEQLNRLNGEKEYAQVDEKVVASTISLDYVNREFKSYLQLFEAALKQDGETSDENRIKRNAEIGRLVEQLDKLIAELPKELFAAKGLPHPTEANAEPAVETPQSETVPASADVTVSPTPATEPKPSKKAAKASKKEQTPKTPTVVQRNGETGEAVTPQAPKSGKKEKKTGKNESLQNGGSSKKASPFKKIIDIKKEIAISILNVGEVLAKTIDYYSLSSGNGKDDDLKELIKISEQQAAQQLKQQQQQQQLEEVSESSTSAGVQETAAQASAVVEEKAAPVVEETKEPAETKEEAVEAKEPEETKEEAVEATVAPVIEEILQVNVNTEEKIEQQAVVSSGEEDTTGKGQQQQQQQQQQSTTASSLSSPTLSTTSSLSGTGSNSPVPAMSASSSEQQQLSAVASVDQVAVESSSSAQHTGEQVTAEATSESTPVMTNANERVVVSSSDEVESKGASPLPSSDLLIESAEKAAVVKLDEQVDAEEADVEKPKHAEEMQEVANDRGLRKEISFLVKEMMSAARHESQEKLEVVMPHEDSSCSKISAGIKCSDTSESSSDILSSSGHEQLDSLTKPHLDEEDEDFSEEKQLSSSGDQAPVEVVFRSQSNSSAGFGNGGGSKRMSLDEELMYQLEEVDKKVKYMNETCSENEGDEDEDDEDEAYERRRRLDDLDAELEAEELEDERLFHPRTPAKIKSEVRKQRNNDLQEEIKQISSVIQDLVQTINVGKHNSSVGILDTALLMEPSSSPGSSATASADTTTVTSQPTADTEIDFYKTPSSSISGAGKRSSASKRSSVSSTHSYSSIPIRQQKMLQKQKATSSSIDDGCGGDEEYESAAVADDSSLSFKSVCNTSEVFIQQAVVEPSSPLPSPQISNTSVKKFRSKLPVIKNK